MANTEPSRTLHSVILRESASAQCDTAPNQQLKFTAYPKASNTARSFARNNFVFAGLSLPSMRI